MSQTFDIIVVGGGSVGSVQARRLSDDPDLRTMLLEAGHDDDNVLIRMPKGNGKMLSDPTYCHYFPTDYKK